MKINKKVYYSLGAIAIFLVMLITGVISTSVSIRLGSLSTIRMAGNIANWIGLGLMIAGLFTGNVKRVSQGAAACVANYLFYMVEMIRTQIMTPYDVNLLMRCLAFLFLALMARDKGAEKKRGIQAFCLTLAGAAMASAYLATTGGTGLISSTVSNGLVTGLAMLLTGIALETRLEDEERSSEPRHRVEVQKAEPLKQEQPVPPAQPRQPQQARRPETGACEKRQKYTLWAVGILVYAVLTGFIGNCALYNTGEISGIELVGYLINYVGMIGIAWGLWKKEYRFVTIGALICVVSYAPDLLEMLTGNDSQARYVRAYHIPREEYIVERAVNYSYIVLRALSYLCVSRMVASRYDAEKLGKAAFALCSAPVIAEIILLSPNIGGIIGLVMNVVQSATPRLLAGYILQPVSDLEDIIE